MNNFPSPQILNDSIRDDIKQATWEVEGEKVTNKPIKSQHILATILPIINISISNRKKSIKILNNLRNP